MADNGFVTRAELQTYKPRYKAIDVPSGKRFRVQSLPEGPLSKLEAFIFQLPGTPEKLQSAKWRQINEEGRRRVLQQCLVDGDGNRLYSDTTADLDAIGSELDGADANAIWAEVQTFIGLETQQAQQINTEVLVKNLLDAIVGGSRSV